MPLRGRPAAGNRGGGYERITKGSVASATLGVVLWLGASAASAQQCDVFTDVQANDVFCNSVQWMKNRAITVGCGAGTTYCPNDSVTRAQMALFMNRLGNAITPKISGIQGVIAAATLAPNAFSTSCSTPTFPAVNYPQIVRAHGSVSIPAAGNNLALSFYASENGGPFQNMSSQQLETGPVNGRQNLSWHSGAFTIDPGTTIRFVVAIVNPAGSGSNLVLQAGRCALHAEVKNFNSETPPFDGADEE